jgi:amidohydrolase
MARFVPFICSIGLVVIWIEEHPLRARARQQPWPLESLQSHIDERLRERHDDLVNFRRDLHRHPELSGREERTAGVIAARLRMLGLEVRTGVGGHGIVAQVRGVNPGPVVAFRADMDAVASDAPDPVEFRSEVPGVRHICGHDIHTTVGIALAEAFSSIRSELAGSLLLVFQPSEENAQGARAMLRAEALRDAAPSAIFALHTAPLEVGQIGTIPGVMLAGRDHVTITLTGSSDLPAAADHARQIIQAASTVEPTATSVSGDFIWSRVVHSAAGPTARSWNIQAVVAATSEAMRNTVKEKIRAGLDPLAARGISYAVDYVARTTPGVTNDAAIEQEARGPLRTVVGDAGLVLLPGIPAMFSEDFGFFQDEAPGVMYFLGVSNSSKGWLGLPHSPQYMADEESIFVGARGMAAVILSRLAARTRPAIPAAPGSEVNASVS